MLAGAPFDDAALFMDELFPLKEEDDAVTSQAATAVSMDAANDMFPSSSLDLVQLLAYDDGDDDAFLDGAFAMATDAVYSPSASGDLSDAMTDEASETSSPPPSFEHDRQLTPVSPSDYAPYTQISHNPTSGGGGSVAQTQMHMPRPAHKQQPAPVSPPAAVVPAPLPVNAAAMLPFAFPVACFPPMMNLNQKRPLPDVMPHTPTESDPSLSKKSKREIRQMKNRESANRSRLRRKAQLSDLSSEVDELMKKQFELQTMVAALQAENKSLHDQNSFLRSLVATSRGVALPPVPSVRAQDVARLTRARIPHSASLSDLESGNRSSSQDDDDADEDDDEDEEQEDVKMIVPTTKKRKTFSRSAASISATGLGLCASVFGLTILADSDNGAAQSSHIRRSGRVLHSLPSTTGVNPGCSPGAMQSIMERGWEVLSSSWAMLSSSELAYGVYLNVLSFVVIMGLYHCFTQYVHAHASTKKSFRWESLKNSKRATASAAANAKRRSVSWQDVRLQTAAQDEPTMPRVQVFA